MQSILREKLLAQANKLAEVSEVYRNESHRFVEAYITWLDEAEKDLSHLRTPISVLLQAEKSSLLSVLDGYLPQDIQAKMSIRKVQKAVAAQSLVKISQAIYAKIETVDRAFDQIRENLCHAIALIMSKEPETFTQLQANQPNVILVWEVLGRTPETIQLYNYFCGKLAATDRDYLVLDIIEKIISNRVDPFHNSNSGRHADSKHTDLTSNVHPPLLATDRSLPSG